jgi:GNAT superfamily N-acetyltransferase
MAGRSCPGDQMPGNALRQVAYYIRDVSRLDIPSILSTIPEADEPFSLEWLISQQAVGDLDYIAAWANEILVGQGIILWHGYVVPELAEDFPLTPVIRSVEVIENYRGYGIGSAIVAELERRARARGYMYASLGVMPENKYAENLWRHLGYSDWGKGFITVTSSYERPGSSKVVRQELFLPMRKRL